MSTIIPDPLFGARTAAGVQSALRRLARDLSADPLKEDLGVITGATTVGSVSKVFRVDASGSFTITLEASGDNPFAELQFIMGTAGGTVSISNGTDTIATLSSLGDEVSVLLDGGVWSVASHSGDEGGGVSSRVASTVQELKALGSDNGVFVGELATIRSTGNVWKCTALDGGGATSTWAPGNGRWDIRDYGAVDLSESASFNSGPAINAALVDASSSYGSEVYGKGDFGTEETIAVPDSDGIELHIDGYVKPLGAAVDVIDLKSFSSVQISVDTRGVTYTGRAISVAANGAGISNSRVRAVMRGNLGEGTALYLHQNAANEFVSFCHFDIDATGFSTVIDIHSEHGSGWLNGNTFSGEIYNVIKAIHIRGPGACNGNYFGTNIQPGVSATHGLHLESPAASNYFFGFLWDVQQYLTASIVCGAGTSKNVFDLTDTDPDFIDDSGTNNMFRYRSSGTEYQTNKPVLLSGAFLGDKDVSADVFLDLRSNGANSRVLRTYSGSTPAQTWGWGNYSDGSWQILRYSGGAFAGTPLRINSAGNAVLGESTGTLTSASNHFFAKQFASTLNEIAAPTGTTFTADWNNSNVQSVDLGSASGNLTATFSNGQSGGVYTLKIIQSATARTITWPAAVLWPGGTAPTLSTGDNDMDVLRFTYDGTNYFGEIVGQAYV